MPEVIDNLLGKRASQAKYSYSDILINLWSIFLCGGDCAEDINNHLKDYLSSIPEVPVANSDTILSVLKNLKTEKEEIVSSTNNIYEINKHYNLNELNIKILKTLSLLKSGELYNFDYDNEVLPTEKYDTNYIYYFIFHL